MLARWIRVALGSMLLLAFWWWMPIPAVLRQLAGADGGWLALALVLFLPLLGMSAWRWRTACADVHVPPMRALRAVLLANALNLVLPAKGGEFIKPVAVGLSLRHGAYLVLWERALDVGVLGLLGGSAGLFFFGAWPQQAAAAAGLAISALGLLAAAIIPRWASRRVPGVRTPRPKQWIVMAAQTAVLSGLHVGQVYCFFQAAGAEMTLRQALAIIPLVFLAPLLPAGPWGTGSREGLLLLLASPYVPHETVGAVALLFLLRYWVPGLLGLPILLVYHPTMVGSPVDGAAAQPLLERSATPCKSAASPG